MVAMKPFLADIWLIIIGFFLLYYAVADGCDLGVGILSLFSHDDEERGIMMSSLKSIWHDHQTWLVLLGGMLFGAFPLFYSLILSALYIPIVIMLFGLVFRGVAFEFREISPNKRRWELAFGIGSLIAALAQGFALGGLLSGITVENNQFTGSVWDWFNPFSMLVATGVLFGYTMLGANFLVMKTEGGIQERSFHDAWIASGFTLAISVAVHIWTALRYPDAADKWQNLSENYFILLFPTMAFFAFLLFFYSIWKRMESTPLLLNIAVILFSFLGLSIALYPNMIPNVIAPPVTVQAAGASHDTLMFMLAVTSILLPVILTYTAYKYQIFRGKIRSEGYEAHVD